MNDEPEMSEKLRKLVSAVPDLAGFIDPRDDPGDGVFRRIYTQDHWEYSSPSAPNEWHVGTLQEIVTMVMVGGRPMTIHGRTA